MEINNFENPKYYVIWRNGPYAGLFSIISGLLGHIKLAEESRLTPVIDLENYHCIYQEKSAINGTNNVFEYYFEPLTGPSLVKIYTENAYILSGGGYPPNFTMSISSDLTLIDIWNRYFKLNEYTKRYLNQKRENLKISERTLGVHFRGQEMRRFRSHPFPMTLQQAINLVRKEIENGKYEKIFLVTEGTNYLHKFKKEFAGMVISSDSYRSRYLNSYKISYRKLHFYKLGLEILTDTILLSECGSLISGSSNVSEFAILLNQNNYSKNLQVRNGTNSSNIIFSKFLWYWKSSLPERLGGFKKFE